MRVTAGKKREPNDVRQKVTRYRASVLPLMASGLNAANIIGEIMEAVGFTALAGWSTDAMLFRWGIKVDGVDIKPGKKRPGSNVNVRAIKMKVSSA